MATENDNKADAENFIDADEQIRIKDKTIEELKRTNTVLKANISTLFRTARAEIERKDERIVQLQSELDDLLFKRTGKSHQLKSQGEEDKNVGHKQ